jgi:hypothetical protein
MFLMREIFAILLKEKKSGWGEGGEGGDLATSTKDLGLVQMDFKILKN